MLNLSVTDPPSSLPRMQKPALLELWGKLFDADPPLGVGRRLMLQFLAYRIQEQKFGALDDRSHRRLKELANAIETKSPTSQGGGIKTGTRLIRQWKDQLHIVNVEEGKYEYRGGRYESLSEIARLITGTRWSGPLFFGLKAQRFKSSEEAV